MEFPSEKEIDVLVIGSCMTDLVAYTERIPKIGETIHGYKFDIGFGGKGANQCVAATKLGAVSAMVAKLGNDSFGINYLKNLQDHEIDISHVQVIPGTSGVAQICVDKEGNNNIIIVAGANNDLKCSDIEKAESLIAKSKIVMFQFETPLETTSKALELCKKYPCKSIVNAAPGKANIDSKILQLSDIFCVNETEAEIIVNEPVKSVSQAKIAAKKLLEMGCKTSIITLGGKGVVFATNVRPESVHISVEEVQPIDTTGAGDAFLGAIGFFLSKFNHLTIEEVINRSCEVAKYSVQKPGTQISFPYATDLPDKLFKS